MKEKKESKAVQEFTEAVTSEPQNQKEGQKLEFVDANFSITKKGGLLIKLKDPLKGKAVHLNQGLLKHLLNKKAG